MAEKEKQKVSKIKVKKKLWFKILAPKLFGEKEIGESYLTAAGTAVGRTVKINLRDLSGSMRDQNAYISFKISGVEGNTLRTETIGYELTPSYVKRAVRKGTVRLDDYVALRSKDGKNVVLKIFMVTGSYTQRSVETQLRRHVKSMLADEVTKSTFEALISNLASYKIQSALRKRLHKVCPVKEVAVRMVKLQADSKPVSVIEEMPIPENQDAAVEEQAAAVPAAA